MRVCPYRCRYIDAETCQTFSLIQVRGRSVSIAAHIKTVLGQFVKGTLVLSLCSALRRSLRRHSFYIAAVKAAFGVCRIRAFLEESRILAAKENDA